MRILLLFIVMLLGMNISVTYAQKDSVYMKATESYQEGDFSQAALLYQSIVDSGYSSPELYYNLGNAYFKLKDLPRAILFYEKAKLLAPADKDIQFNLELSEQGLIDKVEPRPVFFFQKWFMSIRNWFSASKWAMISLLCFILMLSATGVYLFSVNNTLKRTGFYLGVIFFFLSLISFNYSRGQHQRAYGKDYAIIMEPMVVVKSSPDNSGTDLFVIHEGLKVKLKDSMGEWVEIELADGNKGWVRKDMIELI